MSVFTCNRISSLGWSIAKKTYKKRKLTSDKNLTHPHKNQERSRNQKRKQTDSYLNLHPNYVKIIKTKPARVHDNKENIIETTQNINKTSSSTTRKARPRVSFSC